MQISVAWTHLTPMMKHSTQMPIESIQKLILSSSCLTTTSRAILTCLLKRHWMSYQDNFWIIWEETIFSLTHVLRSKEDLSSNNSRWDPMLNSLYFQSTSLKKEKNSSKIVPRAVLTYMQQQTSLTKNASSKRTYQLFSTISTTQLISTLLRTKFCK